VRFVAADVARVAALAKSGETPATFAPGLVVLLATVRTPDADAALVALLEGSASPKVRARAAHVIGTRRAANAVALLRAALADPALEVRLTAQRALEQIDTSAARAALNEDAAVPSSSNDTTGRES
jgi:HEAT repeat protein